MKKIITVPDRNFYTRDTVVVARELLGKLLVHKVDGIRLSGIIVETEAYRYEDDPASHAFRGKTNRNAPMFGPVGHAYVYFIYGNHFCFNIVAKDKKQKAGAVLIRAIEPIDGIDKMRNLRNLRDMKSLTNGPGKLTQALGISREHNALDLTRPGQLYLLDSSCALSSCTIFSTPRIGIKTAINKPWRFCLVNAILKK